VKSLFDCRLYAFVDTAYLQGREPSELTSALCLGGADLIQLRAKNWQPDQVAEAGASMLRITREHGVHLVINDCLRVAEDIGAEFCHLGQEDFFDTGHQHVSELAMTPRIGLSTHAPDQARRAIAAEPAYIAIGPVYPTGTKPTARPVTLEYVRWAAENVRIPWFAIGGITLGNINDVLAAGAQRVCVVSAILSQPDVAETCRRFRTALSSVAPG
jgi:thiamine-phosphate pyrophosphorylase